MPASRKEVLLNSTLRALCAIAVGTGLVGLGLGSPLGTQGPPERPRPGLTAEQTKAAINLAKGAMRELRKKTDGASAPDADTREYIVGVELAAVPKSRPAAGKADSGEAEPAKSRPTDEADDQGAQKTERAGPLAVVTSYRYFDDMTVFSTVDLGTGRVVRVEAAQHLRTPLSDAEFEEAQELAREKSDEVKRLYERFGKELKVYPQFSQFTVKDDPRINRVVHLTYRVGKRDMSYPRPEVNLTTGEVETPAPEAETEPAPKPRRRSD
jgi:hypothetical protein